MRFRVLTAALAVCLYAASPTVLSVEQLVSFIRSSIRLQHPDKQVARFLENVKLTESLDERTIEDLQGEGAGPRTLEALRSLAETARKLPKPEAKAPKPAPSAIPPPSTEEQARVLREVRENALNYTRRLPDFICTQVTRRYVDPAGLELWQMVDVLTARLSYFEQKEDYKLVLVNNRVTDQGFDSVGGATSTGEFGSLLRELFERRTQARFQWERWATMRGKRAHVFSYRVAQPNSQWHISYERRLDIIAGYAGLVYVERDTNMVLRITLDAQDLPPSFPVQQASTTLDYDYSAVGEQQYLLPLKAVVRMRSDKVLTRNDVEFRMYRKFSAEAVVTFDADDTPPPLSEEQTKEQPPK
jgi:hypothetical protein